MHVDLALLQFVLQTRRLPQQWVHFRFKAVFMLLTFNFYKNALYCFKLLKENKIYMIFQVVEFNILH